MNMKLFFATSILLAIVASGTTPAKMQVVSLQPQKPLEMSIASKGELILTATIKKGYHIQANPASEPYLIATKLEFEESEGITVGEPVYPAGKAYKLKGNPKAFSTYEGNIDIKIPVTAGKKVPAGEYKLNGKFRYQACDDRVCLPPQTLPFEAIINLN